MTVCQICQKDFKVINLNHLKKHNTTLEEYTKKYGDPNKATMGSRRPSTNVQAVKEKVKNKGPGLTNNQARTLEDLYIMEETTVVPSTFYWVDQSNPEVLDKVLDLVQQYKKVAVDTETTGLDPYVDKVTHIILTPYDPKREYNIIIPLYHEDMYGNLVPGLLSEEYIIKKLKPILEDPDVRTSWFNLYFDHLMLYTSFGISVANITPPKFRPHLDIKTNRMVLPTWDKAVDKWNGGWDGSIASRILNENEESHKMKDLYKKYLYKDETNQEIKALEVETFEEQFGKIKFYRVPKKIATCYGAKDGYITRKMEEFQKPYIESVGSLDSLLYTIEYPLIKPLCQMRIDGIKLNLDTAKEVGVKILKQREDALANVYKELGSDINLRSPKQVSHALFEVLELPDLQKGSTKSSVLEELAEMGYDVCQNLIDYKKMDKLYGSFIEPAANFISEDGKVHCRFNQLGTRTGRFSSADPNMQQIPARYGIIRTMFEADYGEVLIGADFSQIEPRLTAHTCQDPQMIQAYMDDKDLYSTLAAKTYSLLANRTAKELTDWLKKGELNKDDPVHGLSPLRQQLYKDGFIFYDGDGYKSQDLSPEDCLDGTMYRKMMKTLLLGILYGMSGFGLASRLKLSEEDANGIINDFYTAFSSVKRKMNEIRSFAVKNGFIETEWGRKRRIPDVWSEDKWIRKKADRQLFNSKIQGGAADIMKMAMLLVFYDPRLKKLGFRSLLTVHDELIGSSPKDKAYEAGKLMIEDMVNCIQLSVPFKVDVEIYLQGKWNGDSAQLKFRDNEWKVFYNNNPIGPKELGLA